MTPVALGLVACLGVWVDPASAEWKYDRDRGVAAVKSGEHFLAFVCTKKVNAMRLRTPERVPVIGSGFNQRHETTYSLDGGSERNAALFLRVADMEKLDYEYTVILDVRGADTRLADMADAMERGDRLTLDLWGRDVEFSLEGFDRALSQIGRGCQ